MFIGCNHSFGYMNVTGSSVDGIRRHHLFGKLECTKCGRTYRGSVHAVASNKHNEAMSEKNRIITELRRKLKNATECFTAYGEHLSWCASANGGECSCGFEKESLTIEAD